MAQSPWAKQLRTQLWEVCVSSSFPVSLLLSTTSDAACLMANTPTHPAYLTFFSQNLSVLLHHSLSCSCATNGDGEGRSVQIYMCDWLEWEGETAALDLSVSLTLLQVDPVCGGRKGSEGRRWYEQVQKRQTGKKKKAEAYDKWYREQTQTTAYLLSMTTTT